MSIQSELAQEAKCYCFNDATERAVIVYLLLSKTGLLNMTPSQLAIAAKTYSYDLDTWKKIVAYLLAVDAGLQGDTPKQLADAAKCYCFDEGTWKKVVAFLLASGGAGPVDCPQDMQIAWTPSNLKLGELMGLTSGGANVPLNGILTLTISQASNTDGYFVTGGANTITSVSFPNLISIGEVGFSAPNGLSFNSCSSLASFSAPALTIVRGVVSFVNDASLTALNLNSFTNCEGALSISQNASLISISLPSFVSQTSAGNVDFSLNTSLTSISMPAFVPPNTTNVSINGCALNAASVDGMLHRCVLQPTWGNAAELFDSSGGTNAPPTSKAPGSDYAILVGRGATVNTN